MGHFSNGTEGMMYQEGYCFKCINYRDVGDGRGEGCPIWDLHFLWVGDEPNDDEHPKNQALNFFIPREPAPVWNGDCKMFLEEK